MRPEHRPERRAEHNNGNTYKEKPPSLSRDASLRQLSPCETDYRVPGEKQH